MPTIGSTPNFSLQLPYGNRQNWTDIINGNFRTIDALIATYVSVTNLQGLWENNTEYVVGDNVVDEDSGVVYTCEVANTSSSAPTTFTQERAAHTTYWLAFSVAARSRGAWATATAYALNDFVLADSTKYAMCIAAHTSGANFTTDLALGRWTVIIDLSTAGSLVLPVLAGAADANKVVMADSGGNSYTINTPTALAALMTTLATLANPAFTGSPTAPTQTAEDNSTKIATTAYADAAMRALTIRTQTFSGNGTYTPNAKMVYCIIEAWGGGGAGGGTATNVATNSSGAGGGAGSYSRKAVSKASIGASQTVTIGAAGIAGAAGNVGGGSGGDTSVGVLCIGKGGGGGSGNSATAIALGGAGGIAGTGDITSTGAVGEAGYTGSTSDGSTANGASSLVGGGGRLPVAAGNGGAASGFAAGGSGGLQVAGSGVQSGGAGSGGYVVVTEFCYG